MKYIKTSQVAKAAGVHPNTVRLYEEWGLLQPVPRDTNGYRMYTVEHIEQMHLARIALRGGFVAAQIRTMAIAVIKLSAAGQHSDALEKAHEFLAYIRSERARAEEALDLIERYAYMNFENDEGKPLKRSEVARLLDVSIDVLRNWERNGLINVRRNPENGYRIYGEKEMARLKMIRTLRSANYSMMAVLRMMSHVDMGNKDGIREIVNAPDPEEDIVYATDRWIATLTETENDAQEAIQQLEKMQCQFGKQDLP